MQSTIELVSFNLKTDADETQLNDLQPELNAFIRQQPGFHYRSLVKDTDGKYLDIVFWESEEVAKAAAFNFLAQPWAKKMMSIIDETSIKMRHVQSLSEMGYESAS